MLHVFQLWIKNIFCDSESKVQVNKNSFHSYQLTYQQRLIMNMTKTILMVANHENGDILALLLALTSLY